jgi:hypothetical protein
MLIPRRFVFILAGLVSLSMASSAIAEVPLTDRQVLKRNMKHAKRSGRKAGTNATGSQGLIDASGLKWFIDTNITFSTTSSASGAMSEASYTHAVAATTVSGATVASTLNDAFDGYNSVCLSLDNTVANCATGNANFVIYNKNGPATTECPGATTDRQIVFPTMTTGSLEISRKVYVPDTDSFARWLNSVKNTGATPATVTLVMANNLGSDSNTKLVTSSNGDAVADVTDTWVTSFQNFSGAPPPPGSTSSDVRLGHVLQGPGAPVPLGGINFVDGDDNPYWGYTVTIPPGETASFLNFAVGQPSNAASATKAQELASLPPAARQCLTPAELSTIKNFALGGLYFTVTPCRAFDSRNASPFAAGSQTAVPLVGQCGIPSGASAVSLNVTVTEATDQGNLRLFANGDPLPSASTLNYIAGQNRANNAVVSLSPAGAAAVKVTQASGTVHVVLDVTGYFTNSLPLPVMDSKRAAHP